MTVPTIDPRQVHERLHADGARLIDVRTPGEHRAEHVAGAELIPMDELDAAAIASRARAPIWLLCRTGRRARDVGEKLLAAGADDVRVVEGGLEAWREAGLATVRGKGAISLERQVRIAAGALVLLGVALAWLVHPAFIAVAAFVGAGLVFAGVTDYCGMAMLLAKLPWNRRRATCAPATTPEPTPGEAG